MLHSLMTDGARVTAGVGGFAMSCACRTSGARLEFSDCSLSNAEELRASSCLLLALKTLPARVEVQVSG